MSFNFCHLIELNVSIDKDGQKMSKRGDAVRLNLDIMTITTIGLFDLWKLLNLVTKLLFVLHRFSTMTSSIKILLFDLPGFNPGFKIVLKLLKLPPEIVFRIGF